MNPMNVVAVVVCAVVATAAITLAVHRWHLREPADSGMRDFLIEVYADGEPSPARVGPTRGGFTMKIRQRDGDKYAESYFDVCGYASADGELTLTLGHGPTRFKKTTRRGKSSRGTAR